MESMMVRAHRWSGRIAPPAIALALFLAVAGLSGCGAAARGPEASLAPSGESARVRPGDKVALKVFEEEEMSDTFSVGQNGEVILPKLGSVRVVDQSVLALQDSLRQAYAEYLRNPAVEVTVLRRVGVHGEVNEPGLYLVDLTMTLRDVLAEAGGITNMGDPGKIDIVRGSERIRVGSGPQGGLASADLRSGDQVVVGQRPWIERNSLAFASTAAVVFSLVFPIVRGLF